MGVVLHGIRGRQSWYLHGVPSCDAVQLPALGAADHTEAFNKSQVTSHKSPSGPGQPAQVTEKGPWHRHRHHSASLPLPISGFLWHVLQWRPPRLMPHSHHVTICNMTQIKSPAERNPDLTRLVPYSRTLALHLNTAMTSMTGAPAKSPEQGRARKAAIGVGSQKCYRAGGQTRMAQVTTRLCLSNALVKSHETGSEASGFWGNVVTTALLTGRCIGLPTIGNKHTWTRMTET